MQGAVPVRGGAECLSSVARLATHGIVHCCVFKAVGVPYENAPRSRADEGRTTSSRTGF